MRKLFGFVFVLGLFFCNMTIVSAEMNISEYDIEDTLNGDTKLNKNISEYDFYYKIIEIEYDSYYNGCAYVWYDTSEGCPLSELISANDYISAVDNVANLTDYVKIESLPLNLNWKKDDFKAYIINFVIVDKNDTSKIYNNINTYLPVKDDNNTVKLEIHLEENCSAGDPGVSPSQDNPNSIKKFNIDCNYDSNDNLIHNNNNQNDDNQNIKTEVNPNTGINDYMLYLVVMVIISGSVIVIRNKSN